MTLKQENAPDYHGIYGFRNGYILGTHTNSDHLYGFFLYNIERDRSVDFHEEVSSLGIKFHPVGDLEGDFITMNHHGAVAGVFDPGPRSELYNDEEYHKNIRAFVYYPDDKMYTFSLGDLGETRGFFEEKYFLNNQGEFLFQIVYEDPPFEEQSKTYVFHPDEGFKFLGKLFHELETVFDDAYECYISDFNDRGDILGFYRGNAGHYLYLYNIHTEKFLLIEAPEGKKINHWPDNAFMNNQGQVLFLTDKYYLWKEDEELVEVRPNEKNVKLSPNFDRIFYTAIGLDDYGRVYGFIEDDTDSGKEINNKYVIWTQEDGMELVEDILEEPHRNTWDCEESHPFHFNRQGLILYRAEYSDDTDHMFILTPREVKVHAE